MIAGVSTGRITRVITGVSPPAAPGETWRGRAAAGLCALALGLGAAAGCASLEPADEARAGADVEAFADTPRRPAVPLIFIAMPGAAPFQATRRALVSELGTSFDDTTFIVTPRTTPEQLGAALAAAAPACVVLMNNTTVQLYRDYQRARRGVRFPPAVIVMTSFLEDIRRELVRATGISYEVPGVTALVDLRAVIKAPVSRVGVVYGHQLAGFIERQRVLAAKEHITLLPVEVAGDEPTVSGIRGALGALRRDRRVDALWVLNDNRLLKGAQFLADVWIPAIDALGVPVVVGAEPLVNARAPFGTFAVLPDHAALGVQAANLILGRADDEWRIAGHPIELPLSTITVLDVAQAREKFGLREGALDHIDRLIE
jgi:hypothetical protein